MGPRLLVAKLSFDCGMGQECKQGDPYIGPGASDLLKKGLLYDPVENQKKELAALEKAAALKIEAAKKKLANEKAKQAEEADELEEKAKEKRKAASA